MLCSKCKTENRNVAKFCKNCGSELVAAGLAPAKDVVARYIGFFLIALVIAAGAYFLSTQFKGNIVSRTVEGIIKAERQIQKAKKNEADKFAPEEFAEAQKYLSQAKEAQRDIDNIAALEWIKQSNLSIDSAIEYTKKKKEQFYNEWFSKGWECAQKGLWDESIIAYQKALEYGSGNGKAENELKVVQQKKQEQEQKIANSINEGTKYINDGLYIKAIEEFEKAKALGATGEFDTLLEEAKKKKEQLYNEWFSKGHDYAKKGRWNEAIGAYQKALEYGTINGKAQTELIFVQQKKQEEEQRRIEEARKQEAEAKRKAQETEKQIAGYITTGKEYSSRSNYIKAKEQFKQAINLGATGEVEKLLEEAEKWTIPFKGTGKYANMVYIPDGEFIMGDDNGENDEKPPHRVYLDSYYIDKYEVTFDQYDKFCEATGRKKPDDRGWGRGNMPVINVNWNDAEAYCNWAGKRLPTEAEWEKACRAGNAMKYCFGDYGYRLGDYAWYDSNSGRKAHPVGTKKPNEWGICDMYGNVWELCADWYYERFYQHSPNENPKGHADGSSRVQRGGCWYNNANCCRSAYRYQCLPVTKGYETGFRCAVGAAQNR